MYKAELFGGEHDGMRVRIENSSVPDIHIPRQSTGPVITKSDEVKICEKNNIVVDRYTRRVLSTGEPKWVLVKDGVPIL